MKTKKKTDSNIRMNTNQRIIKQNIDVLYPELSYRINGACFNVHNKLSRFCREKQYGDELESELNKSGIRFSREARISQEEKFTGNIADFIVEDCIILELKAKNVISKDDYYQLKRYLISKNMKLGLIVNFRDTYLKPKRILNNS